MTKSFCNPLGENDDVADDCMYEPFSKKGLHFLHLNARSLLSKLSDVRLLVNNSKAAVLAVSETWLDGSVTDAEIELAMHKDWSLQCHFLVLKSGPPFLTF